MNPYYNLPLEQRVTQRLVDAFNADEKLWKKLAPQRHLRRKFFRGVSLEKLKEMDLLEFATAKAPQDCIGQWVLR